MSGLKKMKIGNMAAIVFLFLLSLFLSPAGAADKVKLQLKWQHQFQFAGYYAAKAKGYYEQAGLDVEIIPAEPGIDPVGRVIEGYADFGVGTSDLLLLRAKGEPVVVLAAIFQHSPLALMVQQSNALQSVHDLQGKRLKIESGSAELLAYLRREGLNSSQYRELAHDFQASDFIANKVDAMSVYTTDEPFELMRAKKPFVLYSPRSGGIDFYGDNLFTTQTRLQQHPEQVQRFREASLRGWRYAMEHPDELIRLIHEQYGQRHGIEHLQYEARQMVPLLRPDLVAIGHMYRGRWEHIASVYAELGMLDKHFNLDGFIYESRQEPEDMTIWYMTVLSLTVVLLLMLAAIARFIQINRQLKVSEQRFRSVFDTSPTAFIVSDFRYKITHWNHAATRLFGWTAQEAIGQSICELLVPETDRAQVYKLVMDAQAQGHVTHSVNANLDRDGNKLTCEWFNATYLDDRGVPCGVLSQGIDITAREHAREKLEEAKRLGDQLLADQQQFIAMISHEFRSPLAVIDAASQVLEMHGPDLSPVPGIREVISRIRRGIKRLTGFIDGCLAQDRLTRLEQHGLKPAFDSIVLSGFLQSIVEHAGLQDQPAKQARRGGCFTR